MTLEHTCCIGDTIQIGNGIRVTVLVIRGQQMKLGILAPKDVDVHRHELYQRIQAEKSATRSEKSDPLSI
ncbi:carbon storage regulator CsrA [Pseudomonas sp. NA-150]|uniref:carbon storage regulator CsrA n=1 Tax=Pseudomonas sp. NA-150 TaxID=3367525 RepID=UPI0037C61F79